MVYKERDASTKLLRSGFGKQVKSLAPNHPSWGFGTSVRENSLKQYISPEHAKALAGNNSQGAVYKTYSSVGPQPESTKHSPATLTFGSASRLPRPASNWIPGPGQYKNMETLGEQKLSRCASAPKAVFGTATRDGEAKVYLDHELMKTYYGKESPGPMAYTAPSAIGTQTSSRKENSPSWRLGSASRFRYENHDSGHEMPGPGQYGSYTAVGKQTLSMKKSLPAFSITVGKRDIVKKIFISKEHEKAAYGEFSPGPNTAHPTTSMGKQPLSIKSNSPGWGFGTAQRLTNYMNDMPGPGTYYA